eukprot:gene6648-3304_t
MPAKSAGALVFRHVSLQDLAACHTFKHEAWFPGHPRVLELWWSGMSRKILGRCLPHLHARAWFQHEPGSRFLVSIIAISLFIYGTKASNIAGALVVRPCVAARSSSPGHTFNARGLFQVAIPRVAGPSVVRHVSQQDLGSLPPSSSTSLVPGPSKVAGASGGPQVRGQDLEATCHTFTARGLVPGDKAHPRVSWRSGGPASVRGKNLGRACPPSSLGLVQAIQSNLELWWSRHVFPRKILGSPPHLQARGRVARRKASRVAGALCPACVAANLGSPAPFKHEPATMHPRVAGALVVRHLSLQRSRQPAQSFKHEAWFQAAKSRWSSLVVRIVSGKI